MNLNGNVEMKGKLSIIVTGQDGSIKQQMVIPNLVVTAGKGFIAGRMVGDRTLAATVATSGTAGQFTCGASKLAINDRVTITGTLGGTGNIVGYATGTVYRVSAVTGTSPSVTGFTLTTQADVAIVTVIGTLTGLTYVTELPVISHMAIGAGTTSPVVGNTTMESSLARAVLTSFTSSTNVVTAVASFAGGLGTGAITEAGLFNHVTTGTMLCRTTFPVVNKGAGDSIAITWAITVS